MSQQKSPAKFEFSWLGLISGLIPWGAAFGSAFLFYLLGQFNLYSAAIEFQSKFSFCTIFLVIPIIIVSVAAFALSMMKNLSQREKKKCAQQEKKGSNIQDKANIVNKSAPLEPEPKVEKKQQAQKNNIWFVWDKIDIKSEVVHVIMFGILSLSIMYREKIPVFFSHDAQLIKKFKEKALELYSKIFVLLIYSWIVMQICESTSIQNKKQKKEIPKAQQLKDQSKGKQKQSFQFVKLSRNVIINVCVIGIIIIEVCIVEIILTKETFFQNFFLQFMQH